MVTQAVEAEFPLTNYVSALLWVFDNITYRGCVRTFAEWTLWVTSGSCSRSVSTPSMK